MATPNICTCFKIEKKTRLSGDRVLKDRYVFRSELVHIESVTGLWRLYKMKKAISNKDSTLSSHTITVYFDLCNFCL